MSRFSDPVGDRKNSERAKAIAEECTELKAKLARVEKLRDDFKDSCDFYSYDMLRMVLEGETEPSTSSCISSSSEAPPPPPRPPIRSIKEGSERPPIKR